MSNTSGVNFGRDNEVKARDVFGGDQVRGNKIMADKVVLAPRQPDWPLFFGMPSMPNHFVGREALLDALVAQLLSGNTPALSAEGQGGIGKTTLAVAVARDPRVRAHFGDGVVWAGLGPQGDAVTALGQWADALGVDASQLPDVLARSQAVKNAIGQRKLLLVIDDA
jgi:hypothetical protein